MRKFIFAILFAAMLFALPATVSAQSAIEVEELIVTLWPEFDQPNMLVIVDLILPETLDFPVSVELPMPGSVAEPFVVASGTQPSTITDTKNYQVAAQGDQNVITYLATGPYVRYEYYDNSLAILGDARAFTFELVFGYAIGSLGYEVQVPVDADQMVLTPDLEEEVGKSDGLNYYRGTVARDLSAGEALILNVQYQKSTDVLTLAAINAAQEIVNPTVVEPEEESSASDLFSNFNTDLDPLSIGLLVFGVILLGVGFYNYMQVRQEKKSSKRGNKRRRSGSGGGAKVKSDVFCHNCGESAYKDDKFCRDCGTKLRS